MSKLIAGAITVATQSTRLQEHAVSLGVLSTALLEAHPVKELKMSFTAPEKVHHY